VSCKFPDYLMSDKKAPAPGDGLRSLRSTGVFRVVNFELYAKPVSITSKPNILRQFSLLFVLWLWKWIKFPTYKVLLPLVVTCTGMKHYW